MASSSVAAADAKKPEVTAAGESEDLLKGIDTVDIDSGRFKYVLLELTSSADASAKKVVVRGHTFASYHDDIVQHWVEELKVVGTGVKVECIGGGRIQRDDSKNSIEVFGYSQGYGKADHSVTAELLKAKFPGYVITWSDEGY